MCKNGNYPVCFPSAGLYLTRRAVCKQATATLIDFTTHWITLQYVHITSTDSYPQRLTTVAITHVPGPGALPWRPLFYISKTNPVTWGSSPSSPRPNPQTEERCKRLWYHRFLIFKTAFSPWAYSLLSGVRNANNRTQQHRKPNQRIAKGSLIAPLTSR